MMNIFPAILFLLTILFCSTQNNIPEPKIENDSFYSKNIPEPKQGESFYSESVEDALDIVKTMRWELLSIDTFHQKGYRDVYLLHYKILDQ